VRSYNLSGTLSEDSERWLQQVRAEEMQRFAAQLARVTAVFNFAILATSFMYGLGVFRVSQLAENISPAIWIVGLSIGAVAQIAVVISLSPICLVCI